MRERSPRGVGLTGLLAGVAAAAPVLVDFSNAGSAEFLVGLMERGALDLAAIDGWLRQHVR